MSLAERNMHCGIPALIEFCNDCDGSGRNIPSMKLKAPATVALLKFEIRIFVGRGNVQRGHAGGRADRENNIPWRLTRGRLIPCLYST